jgi:putative hemolysin
VIFIELFIILTLLLANGVFAMTEMAMVSARRSRLKVLADGGSRGARVALTLAAEPNRFLPSVQVGITLVGLLAGAFGGTTIAEELARFLAAASWLAPYAEVFSVAVVVAALTFLSLVLGELAPKRLALANPERIATLMSRPLDWLSRLARPMIWLLGMATDVLLRLLRVGREPTAAVSEDEVKALMREGSEAGVFHPAEPRMVESVLAFDRCPVKDIMTPRGKVMLLRRDEQPEKLWHKIVVSGHSNYPVYEGSRDRIVGVLSVKAVYANAGAGVAPSVANLMVDPLLVSASETVSALLEVFKRSGKHVGIVVDGENRFQGLVTLVDVLQAIVGELPSLEERLRPEARRRSDGSWLVDGAFRAGQLWAQLDDGLPEREICFRKQTVAEFVAARLDGTVSEGSTFRAGRWRFEVLDMDGERADKVLVLPEGDGDAPLSLEDGG